MTRLLLTTSALAAALALAAGSGPRNARARDVAPGPAGDPCVCKSDPDAGTKPKPHGLLMVADRLPAAPCAQGG